MSMQDPFSNPARAREWRSQAILVIIALSGLAYLLPKIIPIHGELPSSGLDFRLIWVAGRLWAVGGDPYGPLFLTHYQDAFGPKPDIQFWVYPPYWYPIAVPLSFLPFAVSNILWKVFNLSLLIGATHLIARALANISGAKYWSIFLGGFGFACLMQATATTLFIGQTSILVYFGIALTFFGLLKSRPSFVTIGLVFLALKPHMGIVAFAAIAALPRYRLAMVSAAGICFLGTLPIAAIGDYRAAIEGFLSRMLEYSQMRATAPPEMTGLLQIADHFSIPISREVLIGSAIISAFVNFRLSPLNNSPTAEGAMSAVARLALLLAIMLFLIPLQPYNHVALACLLMMIMAFPLSGRWLIGLGLAMCLRPGNVSTAIGLSNPSSIYFPESFFMSLGLGAVFLGTIWAVIMSATQTNASSRTTDTK
jgi:hypothetical protein